MSHPSLHDPNEDILLKPRACSRRRFEIGSEPSSASPTPPFDAPAFPEQLKLGLEPLQTTAMSDEGTTPSRSKSFLNLTTSTLFGIYQPGGYGTDTEPPTPFGTGAETPATSRHASVDLSRVQLLDTAFEKGADGKIRRKSTAPALHRQILKRRGFKGYFLPLAGRVMSLFAVGMLYGLLISHLHDRQQLMPVTVNLDRSAWSYLITWGLIGVALGEALPWADVFWAPEEDSMEDVEADEERQRRNGRGAEGWMDVVRSIGAFVGIAFAIRKLPWQSTLQLSLTLALANPAVWYLIDRSPPGFILSTIVALSGTAVLLGVKPALVPSPSSWQMLQNSGAGNGIANETATAAGPENLVLGVFSQESIGVATWIASVLFVSSVCFGNIGRQLAPHRS